ncbi:hypothetical protein [Streptomyces sp. NRRL F-5123]|uniref:hypothetical protein n=1 Tax=Streptomyces sp. NRRL F-5123 TaxID=1463856 RepID=UPI0004E0B8BB|nr:hypothetical protein [Streptomyces sp. NRRL F-5123]
MPSPCDPRNAPAGDVGAALMMIDSRLRTVYAGRTGPDAEQEALIEQFAASMDSDDADALLDGACTLVYMYMCWLKQAYADHGKDVIESVVPSFVATLGMMPRSVPREAIPTMTGLVVAAGTGLSPSLWRLQYGYWTEPEIKPLEVTAFLLAEHINRLTDDREFATRMIADALSGAEASAEQG